MSKERTGRGEHKLKAEEASAFLGFVARLPVVVDWTTQQVTFGTATELARRTGLTVYDALYLELAQRLQLPLGSLDDSLCAAAKNAGVEVLTKEFLATWEDTGG